MAAGKHRDDPASSRNSTDPQDRNTKQNPTNCHPESFSDTGME
jgi:hypothetical protein